MIRLTVTSLVCASAVLALASGAARAQQRQQTFHKPLAPIGPTSEEQCRRLEAEWAQVCRQIADAHQQCLDAYNGSDVKGAGECSRGPCLSLHVEMTTCGGAERQQAVSSCYAQVRSHRDREAEFQRVQAQAVRAQQEAERARRQQLQAEAARYSAEADAARRRAEQYRRDTPTTRQPQSVDGRQTRTIAELRDRAGTAAAAVDAVTSTIAETDLSDLTASVQDVLRHEGIDLLATGLAQIEPFDEAFEKLEMAGSIAELATGLWNGAVYARSRLHGTLPPGPDWNAMLDSIEFISSAASNVPIPQLSVPTLSPVANVVRGLRNAHDYAYRQLQGMVQAFIGGTPFQPDADFDGNFFRELVNPSIPLERAERLSQAAKDASYTVETAWDNATNKLNRLFNP